MTDTLHLTLHRKWFDEILSGKKKIEYREIKPYWTKRLFNSDGSRKSYTKIIFKNGYSKNAPEMTVELKGIEKKDEYGLLLGEIIETKNVDGRVQIVRILLSQRK